MGVSSRVVSIDDERRNMDHRRLTLGFALPVLFCSALARAQPPPQQDANEPRPVPFVVVQTETKKELPATSRWQMSIYGFAEFEGMYDTTQSFSDSPGNSPILRSDGSRPAYLPVGTDELKGVIYGAYHGRMQATVRNSRFGFKLTPPEYAGIKSTGVIEVDLFGNQPSNPPSTSEGS